MILRPFGVSKACSSIGIEHSLIVDRLNVDQGANGGAGTPGNVASRADFDAATQVGVDQEDDCGIATEHLSADRRRRPGSERVTHSTAQDRGSRRRDRSARHAEAPPLCSKRVRAPSVATRRTRCKSSDCSLPSKARTARDAVDLQRQRAHARSFVQLFRPRFSAHCRSPRSGHFWSLSKPPPGCFQRHTARFCLLVHQRASRDTRYRHRLRWATWIARTRPEPRPRTVAARNPRTRIVIDGGILCRWTRRRSATRRPLDPDEIAPTYLSLLRQPRNAWTWEIESRTGWSALRQATHLGSGTPVQRHENRLCAADVCGCRRGQRSTGRGASVDTDRSRSRS